MNRLLCLLLFFSAFSYSEEFKVPSDKDALAAMKTVLHGKNEYIQRSARRLGNKTLEVDCYVSMAADLATFAKVTSDFGDLRNWALFDINKPGPSESGYLLELHDLNQKEKEKLSAKFSFNLPFFTRMRGRTFKMTTHAEPKSFTLIGETQLNENSAVKMANAYMKALPAQGKPGNIWIQVKAVVVFGNRFFYEALPEKVLLREVGDRLHYLVQNYQKEESRRKGSTASHRATAAAPPVAIDPADDL